jgi:hypothetical protein
MARILGGGLGEHLRLLDLRCCQMRVTDYCIVISLGSIKKVRDHTRESYSIPMPMRTRGGCILLVPWPRKLGVEWLKYKHDKELMTRPSRADYYENHHCAEMMVSLFEYIAPSQSGMEMVVVILGFVAVSSCPSCINKFRRVYACSQSALDHHRADEKTG